MALFQGAGVALVTPFRENKSVNYEELTKLIEFQIKSQTDALIVLGTTGEPSTMTEEERISVVSSAVKTVNGRIPVIVGSGGNNTKEVIAFSKKCEQLGADGLLIVTPYYNKCTQNGLYTHYKMIADAVSLPIIMYNVPSRTGVNLLPQTAARLGKDAENIVAVKEASGNITQTADLIRLADGSLDVYSGNDDQIIPILSLGGIGVISVLSNIAPKDTHDMVMEYLNGNTKQAAAIQLKYMELIHALFSEVNPIPVKKALVYKGFDTKTLRLPLTEMEELNAQKLKACMERMQIK